MSLSELELADEVLLMMASWESSQVRMSCWFVSSVVGSVVE
jgi:hypothetical protein